MGGSMQQLWGMVRSLQTIILASLVKVNFPGNVHNFIQGCMSFASIDIFSAEEYYPLMFAFTETTPFNDEFEQFEIDNKNWLVLSGSYYVFTLFVVGFLGFKKLVNFIAAQYPESPLARKIGIWAY
jgi:hypothetical protein